MNKLSFHQSLQHQQKLSPQQIQFIQLLQVSTAELETRIEEELELNPALEEYTEEKERDDQDEEYEEEYEVNESDGIEEYLQDDYAGYKMQGDLGNPDKENKESPISSGKTLQEYLISQFGYLKLDERQEVIGRQLIGSIDSDGYIRRNLEAIANDLAFSQGIETDEKELEILLYKIQTFDSGRYWSKELTRMPCYSTGKKGRGKRNSPSGQTDHQSEFQCVFQEAL